MKMRIALISDHASPLAALGRGRKFFFTRYAAA